MPAKILVVDDESDVEVLILQIFRKQIKNNNFHFLFACNGRDALDKLNDDRNVDLILTDINMPEMDGLTFLSKLKEIDKTIDSIVISAYGDMDNIRTAMHNGAFDFLIKPLDINELEFTVTKSLEHVNQTRENITLLREKDAAESESKAKSAFLAGMSHEMRTPLNAILGMTDLLMETDLSIGQKNYISILDAAGETLLDLINDTLDLSKIEAGHLDLEIINFSIRELIGKISGIMSVKCNEKGLTLVCKIASDVSDGLKGDPTRLRQIIINLIGNAVKFTDKGKIQLNVNKESSTDDEVTLRFIVKDTGIGIPADKTVSIFKEFSQAESSTTRKYGGTGLGLSISKKLVEMMNGKIWVESRVGEGSSFIFTAKFGSNNIEGSYSSSLEYGPTVIFDSSKKNPLSTIEINALQILRILLADDSEHNRIVIQHFLKDSSHRLDCVENGQEALTKFKNNTYDVVLLDMQMPIMDGYTAAKEMRKWERENKKTETPIVALTGVAFQSEVEKILEAGCTEYVAKPVRKMKFIDTIVKYCEGVTDIFNGGKESLEPNPSDLIINIESEMEKIVPSYLEGIKKELTVIQSLLSSNDLLNIKSSGHRMKGSGGAYGFDKITAIGDQIEIAAADNQPDLIQKSLDELAVFLDNVKVNYV